jgi:hypothetical protein
MTNKRIVWHPELRKLSDLVPYEKSGKKNPRIIDEFGLAQLKSSFDDVGMLQPLVINLDNTILSGHARWLQLSSENPDGEVYVMVPDRMLTPKQEEAVLIRTNKNIAGKWDWEELANSFEIDDLLNWGFTGVELGNLENLEKIDNETKDNDLDGLPDFHQEEISYKSIIVHFATEKHFHDFFKLINQPYTEKIKSIWFPEAKKENQLTKAFVNE